MLIVFGLDHYNDYQLVSIDLCIHRLAFSYAFRCKSSPNKILYNRFIQKEQPLQNNNTNKEMIYVAKGIHKNTQ